MKTFCVILTLALCAGCTCGGSDEKKESVTRETDTTANGGAKESDLAALVEGNNQFAFDLYHQLAQAPGNKFFSPYSISTALGMTYAGARGNTAKEMAKSLHFTVDNERLHPAFGELIRRVNGTEKKRNYELAVANGLWAAKGFSLEPAFLRVTQTDYQAGLENADFMGNAEGARQRINGWVEDRTNKKIADLIPKGLLQSTTVLVLVNAIYFKGDWAAPFAKEATKPDDFALSGGATIRVPMMNQKIVANYMANPDFQLVELPYKDNEVSIVLILPRKKDGLAQVENKLSVRSLKEALALVNAANLQVAMPRFKMTETFSLGGELAKMGMQEAFQRDRADFSGMSKGGRFSLSEVIHKAFVDINETGTEAAAATAVHVADKSKSGELVPFRVDHPFLFLLRHNATGSILFLGRVSDPREVWEKKRGRASFPGNEISPLSTGNESRPLFFLQWMISPGTIVSDVHALFAFPRCFDERVIDVDACLVEELGRLLLPESNTHLVEDGLKDVDGSGIETAAEIASGRGVGDALGAQSIQEAGVVTPQFHVLQTVAAGQGVHGKVEYVIGMMVGQKDLEQMEFLIDEIHQADVFGELIHERNASQARTAGALGKIITQAGTASNNGRAAIRELCFVEPAEDVASACSQPIGTLALVAIASGSILVVAALHFALASGVLRA